MLRHPERPLQDLCDDVLYRLRNDPCHGDVFLLLARTHALPDDQVAAWHLEYAPRAVGTARTHARHQLAHWGVDEETAYTTETIVSELVTNAVRYGTPPLRLQLSRTAHSPARSMTAIPRTAVHHAKTIDEGGRGLFIVAQLAQNWGVRYGLDDKAVWAEQPLSTTRR